MNRDLQDFMKRWPVNVKNKRLLLLISLFVISSLRASENDLKAVVEQSFLLKKTVNENLSAPYSNPCSNLSSNKTFCPQIFLDEIRDNNKSGIVGKLNLIDKALTGSEDFSTPNQICKNATFNKEESTGVKISCPGLSKQEHDYLQSFYLEKKSILETNMISLLSAKGQIDLLLGKEKDIDCKAFDLPSVQITCQNLKNCQSIDKELFSKKLDSISKTVELVRMLKKEARNNPGNKEFDYAINSLLEANPILKSKNFQPLLWGARSDLKREEISSVYKRELEHVRGSVTSALDKNHRAYLCLEDKSIDCNNFSEIASIHLGDSTQLEGKLSPSYLCLANAKENRNVANKVLNDAALSAAMTFTPMAGLALMKVLYRGGKLITSLEMLDQVKKQTMVASMLADSLYAGNEILKIKKSCEEKIVHLQKQGNGLSCNSQEEQIQLQVDAAQCSSQVLTAGLSTLAPALGIMSIRASKVGASKAVELLKTETDDELSVVLKNMVDDIPDASRKTLKLKDLETKALSLLKSSERYSKDEIKAGLRVLMRRCLGH
jgi:hypothetical protein